MTDMRVISFALFGIMGVLFGEVVSRGCETAATIEARPRECARIGGPDARRAIGYPPRRVVDRVCRCADGKVTVLP